MDVIVYFNAHPDHYLGYEHGHPLRRVFSYEAPTTSGTFQLADEAFHAFNAPPEMVLPVYRPVAEAYRAVGLRSLSVGDVLRVGHSWLACAATSWIALAEAPSEASVDDSPVKLLVVTPAGEVRDYLIEPTGNMWRTSTYAVLHALYDQIGCTAVDVVRLASDVDMWVDDEGALKPQLRVNQLASYIATRFGLPFQLYVGTVVFAGGPDEDGNTTSLSKSTRDQLVALIDELRSIRWGR